MYRAFLALTLIASIAAAQPSKKKLSPGKPPGDEPRKLRAWFKGGIGVEFSLQSSAPNSSITNSNGVQVSDEGTVRIVRNPEGDLLFSYRLEAVRGKEPDTVTIRIKPTSPEAVASHTTVGATREFPDL